MKAEDDEIDNLLDEVATDTVAQMQSIKNKILTFHNERCEVPDNKKQICAAQFTMMFMARLEEIVENKLEESKLNNSPKMN